MPADPTDAGDPPAVGADPALPEPLDEDALPWAGPDTAAVEAVVADDPPPADPAPIPSSVAAVPAVVAVMVTHDPGEWLEESLRSFVDQRYPDLALLVVDTGSEIDPTPRIAAVAPEAHVHRLDHDPGFGAAANLVSDLVEGASFYVFCHDDVALEPDTIRALVEEAFRSNAGIIGPKLVSWDDPRRLLQVGMGADKTGVLAPIAERGELDQEQHDAVRDVFVVPGGCTLVRADLFDALGGYDDGIDFLGEDLDLCWRAHVLGARVLIGPSARARHLESAAERRPAVERRGLLARHRLRTSLVSYGRWHRLRVLPQAFFLTLVEALYGIVSARPGHARAVVGAWTWNLRRLPDIRRRRRALQGVRRVGDKGIRALQVRGSARFSAFLRGQMGGREDRVAGFARSSRDLAGSLRDGARQLTGAFAILLTVVVLVSSRDLLPGGLPAVGELARFPDSPRAFLDAWWSGWRRGGLGGAGSSPTGLGLLGLAGYISLGATGLLRDLLVVGTVPLGALGAWRLARPIGSTRSSVAAFAVYLAIPVPYNALARGSWSGLLLYATSPWILLMLGRASGVAPFGPVGAEPPSSSSSSSSRPAAAAPRRRRIPLILGLGLVLAATSAFVPVVLPATLAMTAAFALGSLFVFRVAGVVRMLTVSVGAVAVAVALHVPWSIDVLTSTSPWEAAVGVRSTAGGPLTLGRILRFESGPWGAPPLGWAFLLAGVLPVVIGRSWRLEWAVRAWFVVLGGWALLWAGQTGRLPVGLPAAEVVLAPVAAALALAAALGLAAFETDLRAYRFGWRQVLSVAAALGVALGAVPLASGILDGRWRMPTRDFSNSIETLVDPDQDGAFRVLWLGDANLLPVTSWRYDQDLAYASTDQGVPTVLDRMPGEAPGATGLLAKAVHLAEDQRTNRLGHLLAPMGVRYLVVPTQLSPASADGAEASGDDALAAAQALEDVLAQQLDLQEVPVRDGLVVYRNIAWVSSRAVLPARSGDRIEPTQAVGDDLTAGQAALAMDRGAVGAVGEVPATGDLLVASTADDGWKVRVGGVPLARGETYGWANQFTATRTGPAELTFDTPVLRRLALVGQATLWGLVILVRRRSRTSERAAAATLVAATSRPAPTRRARGERRAARRARPTEEGQVGRVDPNRPGRRGRRRGRPTRDEDGESS